MAPKTTTEGLLGGATKEEEEEEVVDVEEEKPVLTLEGVFRWWEEELEVVLLVVEEAVEGRVETLPSRSLARVARRSVKDPPERLLEGWWPEDCCWPDRGFEGSPTRFPAETEVEGGGGGGAVGGAGLRDPLRPEEDDVVGTLDVLLPYV